MMEHVATSVTQRATPADLHPLALPPSFEPDLGLCVALTNRMKQRCWSASVDYSFKKDWWF